MTDTQRATTGPKVSKRQLTAARQRLFSAINAMADTRAQASGLNGYRAVKDSDDARRREMGMWNHITDRVWPRVDRAVRAYAAAVRKAGATGKGPR